jgi:hypothetical protein
VKIREIKLTVTFEIEGIVARKIETIKSFYALFALIFFFRRVFVPSPSSL